MAGQLVRDIMITDIATVTSDTSASAAAEMMRDRNIGDVIVTGDGGINGIVTDRDLVVRIIAEHKDPEQTAVSEACTTDLYTVTPDTPVDEVIKGIRERDVRRVPVVESGRPVGILTIGDLAVIRDSSSVLADISAAPPNG